MNQLEKKEFNKRIYKVVLPITVQYFMFALVPVSDSVMLAVLDQDSVSAVSLASQFLFVMNLFISAFISGASLFAAQYWGSGDKKSIEKLYGMSFAIVVPLCIVFFCCALFAPEYVMRIYTNEPQIIEYGAKYLVITSFYYLMDGVIQIIYTFMKNTELVRPSTVIASSAVVLNIIFNAIFIYGLFGCPQMGAEGAALGSTLSCLIATIAAIVYFAIKGPIKFKIRNVFVWDKTIAIDFIKYVPPLLANSLGWGLGFTMISVIMGHLGSDAVAANSIVAVVKDLISSFCWALAAGGSIVVGNLLGAGELDKAKEYGDRLCKVSVISGAIGGLIIVALIPGVLWLVNLSEQSEKYLAIMMLMCVYYIIGRAINTTTIGGIFTAGGDTRFGFLCDTVTMWAFIIPAGALAAFVFKLPILWVYFILNLDEMIKIPVVWKHYKKYKWVKKIVS